MAGLYDIVEAFQAIGAQIRATTEDAEAAREAVRGLNKERAEAARSEAATTSAMGKASSGGGGMGSSSGSSGSSGSTIQNASSPGSVSIETSDLGDTRSAEEQMARMIASIQAATRR